MSKKITYRIHIQAEDEACDAWEIQLYAIKRDHKYYAGGWISQKNRIDETVKRLKDHVEKDAKELGQIINWLPTLDVRP